MRVILLLSILLLTGCSQGPIRVEVQLIKPPAQFLVTRIGPAWKPGGTNKDLGEFAKTARDWGESCEADKAAIAKFIAEYAAQHGTAP